MAIYLVGGAIRDLLLGKNIHDKDFVIVGDPAKHQELINKLVPVQASSFPVYIDRITGYQYALARTERKVGKGHKGFACFSDSDVTIEEDLSRRDLTINAIALSTNGQYVDPHNGILDIRNRIIRHVDNAFKDDPLRVLRVARFKALLYPYNFVIDQGTIDLLVSMSQQPDICGLSGERILLELNKALNTKHPSQFLQTLELINLHPKEFSYFRSWSNENLQILDNLSAQNTNSQNMLLGFAYLLPESSYQKFISVMPLTRIQRKLIQLVRDCNDKIYHANQLNQEQMVELIMQLTARVDLLPDLLEAVEVINQAKYQRYHLFLDIFKTWILMFTNISYGRWIKRLNLNNLANAKRQIIRYHLSLSDYQLKSGISPHDDFTTL